MTPPNVRTRFIEQTIAAQEQERARIARELHDGIGQTLTSLLVGLRTLESALGDDHEARQLAERLREAASGAIDEVRALAHGLRPTALDDLGLGPAIRRLTEDVSSRHGFAIDLQMSGLERGHRLPSMVEITIYRIVQEALNNVAKHAEATQSSVILQREPSRVRIIVEDDGRGIQGGDKARGFGLQGIRERLAAFHGELIMESGAKGTALFATLPIDDLLPLRTWVTIRGSDIPVPPGEYMIGRSPACELHIDSPRVSRRHARLLIGERDAQIEDLESTNRVYVNGRVVEGAVSLREGDEIAIGGELIHLRRAVRRVGADSGRHWGMEKTLPGRVPGAPAGARVVTQKAQVLELIGPIALRLLDNGQADEAEQLLRGHLQQVLNAAQAGERIDDDVIGAASYHAVRLAATTRRSAWIDVALELLERTVTPPLPGVIAVLESLAGAGLHGSPERHKSCVAALCRVAPTTAEPSDAVARLAKLTPGSGDTGGREG